MSEEKAKIGQTAQSILDSIEKMTVLELAELVKAIEVKFGVSATPVVTQGVATAGASGAGEAKEEKTSFNVILAESGSNKIQVIKEIRTITNLGLKEAKDLVESAPKTVKENATKQEADEIKKKLEAAGAKVELK